MTNDNPWKVLAERLGESLTSWGSLIRGSVTYGKHDTQDLLIGRARRVVAEALAEDDEKFTEEVEMLQLSLCNDVGTPVAIAAIALLDAVGYNPPS